MATPPSAPIITLAPRASNQTLEFKWSPPTSAGSAPINLYSIEIYGSGGGLALGDAVNGSTFYYKNPTIIPLTNGELYFAIVKASNDGGFTYGPSASFRPFAPGSSVPGIPQSVSASRNAPFTSALVSWNTPAGSLDSPIFWYVIVSSSNNPSDPVIKRTANGLTQTSLLVTGLNISSTYTFTVRAVNCPGYGPAVPTNSVVGFTRGSVVYNSASDYLGLSSGIIVGTSDFSLDFFFKINTSLGVGGQTTPIMGIQSGLSTNLFISHIYQTGLYNQFIVGNQGGSTNTLQFPNLTGANTWFYVAIARQSNQLTGWFGAVSSGTANRQFTGLLTDANNYLVGTDAILRNNATGTTNNMQITNLRFQLGASLFTVGNTSISIPVSPLTGDGNTQLLLLSQNPDNYIRNSAPSSAITLTAFGAPTWSSQVPFA